LRSGGQARGLLGRNTLSGLKKAADLVAVEVQEIELGLRRGLGRGQHDESDEDDEGKFYDQIAWFTADEGRPALSLDYRESGAFDFQEVALPRRGLSRRSLSWRVSDHYPLWAAFEL